jgi:hypothetical protein
MELRQRSWRVEPVKRLRRHDRVDRAGREGERLGHRGDDLDARDAPSQGRPNRIDRLDRNDPGARDDELSRQLSRSCAHVDDRSGGSDPEGIDQPRDGRVRIAGSGADVGCDPSTEGGPGELGGVDGPWIAHRGKYRSACPARSRGRDVEWVTP